MDTNADVYDRTDTQFCIWWKHGIRCRGSQESWEVYLSRILYHRKKVWYGIVFWDFGRKGSSGVEVKLLWWYWLYSSLAWRLHHPASWSRIEAHKFNKVIPRLTVAYNNSDHRKIIGIDGRIAYTGGINLADRYINHNVLVTGRIAVFGWMDRQLSFYQALFICLVRRPWKLVVWPVPSSRPKDGMGLCIPYSSGPKPYTDSSWNGLPKSYQSSYRLRLYHDSYQCWLRSN